MIRFGWSAFAVATCVCLLLAGPVQAQSPWPDYPSPPGHGIERGPGNYFSWIKLVLLVVVFLIWVRAADWINRDAIRYSEFTGMNPRLWNPFVVLSFVAGLVAVLCIPVFV